LHLGAAVRVLFIKTQIELLRLSGTFFLNHIKRMMTNGKPAHYFKWPNTS